MSHIRVTDEAMQVNEHNRIAFDFILSYLDGKDHRAQIVFDNGCDGARAELTPLMLNAGMEVVGLDINEGWIKEQKDKLDHYPNLKLVCGDAHYLPFKDEVFDIVTMVEVIEHLAKPDLALAEIHRCLRINGKLILSTPNAFGIQSLVIDRILFWLGPLGRMMRMWKYHYPTSRHISLFTLHHLTKSLNSHHFKVEQVISSGGLGIVMLISAIFHKLRFPLLGRYSSVTSSRLYATLHSLECKMSKIVPLRLHSGWVIIASKHQDEHRSHL